MEKTQEYPDDTFSGRGIVMTGGGAKYTVTSYLAVSMLRLDLFPVATLASATRLATLQ